jgi:predicted  nucleic acid-binding Zn-ribbon protein
VVTEDTTKLNATIKQLQEENKSLQMDKFNSAIELSKVESQLQMEKHQHDMLKNKRQTYMNSLLSENEILREKLVRKTEECEHLSNEQKQLNNHIQLVNALLWCKVLYIICE